MGANRIISHQRWKWLGFLTGGLTAFDPVTWPDPFVECFETIHGQQLVRKPRRFSGL